ncbi:MAG TPA: hypothetical protein DDW52_08295 [Planctomycetaceae bacterium]|nr:hypothetical protein [Planctomycetaceae bacterium]
MKLNQFIRNASIPSVATTVLLVGTSYGETRLSNTNVSLAFESATESFLEDTCLDCHSGASADAGLDLETLPRDGSALEKWVSVYDRVSSGEMPPPEDYDVDSEEREAFTASLCDVLRRTQRHQHASLGRAPTRKLTNDELEHTLHDLLGIDIPLASLLPDEQRSGGFNNIGAIQSMSHFQLENHLNVVDAALDAAWHRAADSGADFRRVYSARDLARANPSRRCRDPEMREGLAVVWSSTMAFYGRVTSTTIRRSGWYRIRFTASAVRPPDDKNVWCSVRSGRCNSGAPLMTWIGAFEASENPQEWEFTAWLPENHMLEIRPGDATLKTGRFRGGQVGAGEGEPQDIAGVALHEMLIEQIHPGGSLKSMRRKVFGKLPVEINQGSLVYTGENAGRDTREQLRKFASRAFRRDVTDAQLRVYLQLLDSELAAGKEPVQALRTAYRALLCSPRFLYLQDAPGPLDDLAIASRLSYMLWGSLPDRELLKLARSGELRDSENLLSQVERMLAAPRGQDFVKRFTAQWLDLVDIDFTEPDRKQHRDFDVVVQNSMLAETREFVKHLLDNNRPAIELVDADYTFLNSRLAEYYGIDGIEGDAVRLVSVDPQSHRGGLLTHGAVLKVTANGTNTSPVLRGVWVSERLLGQPIPPPPENVPAIEPDVRGAKSIRDMLEKHRADAACASCHAKIDPPGYALENFDAAGRWRTQYGKKQPINSGYILPDGRPFDGPESFRELMRTTPKPIAKCFAEKLVTFATGHEIAFVDREHISNIVDATADTEYGVRSLLDAVVTSPLFLNK